MNEYDPIKLKQEFGLSLRQLASLLGVSITTAGRWNNKTRNPSQLNRIKAAKIREMFLNQVTDGSGMILTTMVYCRVKMQSDMFDSLEAERLRRGCSKSKIVRWCINKALPEFSKIPVDEPF